MRGFGMKTYCLTLDLQEDRSLIEEYKRHHRRENIWPEVIESILSQGVLSESIYLLGSRLVMILQTTDEFDLEAKVAADAENAKMREWESLMWKNQKLLPSSRSGEKWVLMENIFELP
jgi:L-rhamnose mutarotase